MKLQKPLLLATAASTTTAAVLGRRAELPMHARNVAPTIELGDGSGAFGFAVDVDFPVPSYLQTTRFAREVARRCLPENGDGYSIDLAPLLGGELVSSSKEVMLLAATGATAGARACMTMAFLEEVQPRQAPPPPPADKKGGKDLTPLFVLIGPGLGVVLGTFLCVAIRSSRRAPPGRDIEMTPRTRGARMQTSWTELAPASLARNAPELADAECTITMQPLHGPEGERIEEPVLVEPVEGGEQGPFGVHVFELAALQAAAATKAEHPITRSRFTEENVKKVLEGPTVPAPAVTRAE